MHSGFGSGTGFGSGAEIKWNEKSFHCPNHNITNDDCLGINAASNIKKARLLYNNFYFKKCAKYDLDPAPEPETDPAPSMGSAPNSYPGPNIFY